MEAQMSSLTEHQADLVVVGGGSGGFGAALAAARAGLDVIIVEQSPTIGGNANRCGVNNWEAVAGATGFPFEIYRRLKRIPLATAISGYGRHVLWDGREAYPGGERVVVPSSGYRDTLIRHGAPSLREGEDYAKTRIFGVVFEPSAYEAVLWQMLGETGRCRVITSTIVGDIVVDDGVIRRLELSSSDASRPSDTVVGRYFLDGTGDGDLCRLAGCKLVSGQESRAAYDEPSAPEVPNDRVNASTLMFRVTPTVAEGVESLPAGVPAACWWRDRFPAVSCVHFPNGDLNVNMLPTMEGREYLDLGHDAAYEESRRRVYATWHHIQSEYPEFRRFKMHSIAPSIGVRESYRVITDYVLTEHDVRRGVSESYHPDIIAIADHALDRHGASGGAKELAEPFGIPYRTLLPKGFSNLAVACRAAGFSSIAASSCRLSRTMMHLGQAAGTAAALAAEQNDALAAVSSQRLRGALSSQQVQLEWPTPEPIRRHLEEDEWTFPRAI